MSEKTPKTDFKPRKIKEDDLYEDGYTLIQLRPNIFQFASIKRKHLEEPPQGSHVYLIIGENINVLIDTGIVTKFNSFNYLLTTEIGLKVEDINLVINTHEHFDHLSANSYFRCPIAAHRWAAVKIQSNDEFIMKGKHWGVDLSNLRVNIWLEDRTIFDLGTNYLQIVETPGHTSGSICVFEPIRRILFSGDTLFSGLATNIYESGSISEYINSLWILNTLRIKECHAGHGKSIYGEENITKEIRSSIDNAYKALNDYIEKVKSKPIEEMTPPPSLYDRDEQDL